MPRRGRRKRKSPERYGSATVPIIHGEASCDRHRRRLSVATAEAGRARDAFGADGLKLETTDDFLRWQVFLPDGKFVNWWPTCGDVAINGKHWKELPHVHDWVQFHRFTSEVRLGLYWREQDGAKA